MRRALDYLLHLRPHDLNLKSPRKFLKLTGADHVSYRPHRHRGVLPGHRSQIRTRPTVPGFA